MMLAFVIQNTQNFPPNYTIKIVPDYVIIINPETNTRHNSIFFTHLQHIFYGPFSQLVANLDILDYTIKRKQNQCDVYISINTENLFKKLDSHKPFGHRDYLVSILKKTSCVQNTSLHEKVLTKLCKPLKYQPINKNDKDFSNLFDYQEYNIKWMRRLENETPRMEIRNTDLVKLTHQKRQMYFDINTHSFLNSLPENSINEIQFRGGALIDEMGCGKTACAVSHILTSLPKRFPKLKLTKDGLIATRATLIVLPNHICNQWLNEINKFNPNKTSPTVITIANSRDYKKYKIKDIINTEIILIPYQFFFNDTLDIQLRRMYKYSHNTEYYYSYRQNNWSDMKNGIQIYISEHTGNATEDDPLNIFFFKWHRLIWDECQEMMANYSYHRRAFLLDALNTNYRWCLTGTPFHHPENFRAIVNFLTNNTVNIKSKHLYIALLKNGIFRRNTKLSTKHETKLGEVKIIEKVIWVRFTHEERTIYQSNANQNLLMLRQICCCPFTPSLLSHCKSFADIIRQMKKHFSDEVNRLNRLLVNEKMNEQNFKIQYENAVNGNFPNDIIQQTERRYRYHEQRVQKLETEINQARTSISYYDTLNQRLEEREKMKCPVCYSSLGEASSSSDDDSDSDSDTPLVFSKQPDLPKSVVAMTKCGHLFCSDCINDSLKVNPFCPTCRIHLRPTDVYIINDIDEANRNNEEYKLYKTVGSKIAKLILHIRKLIEDPENYIILFAEWEETLTKIRTALTNYGIKNVICKGNKYTRESAIRKFNDEKTCRVIALSSSYASSGTNLTKANKIIFINPVGGDAKHRKDVEDQAIARSFRLGQKRNIEVIRFIVKDTIEETIFKQVPQSEDTVEVG